MFARTYSKTSQDIARWSEPLVADQIYAAYERAVCARNEVSETLGRQHCRMWRNLLCGETQRAQFARRDLVKLARMASVDLALVEEIDAAIFDFLLGVVLRRCHGSEAAARIDGLALVQAASTLGEIRMAA
jgi:hypothetical protein